MATLSRFFGIHTGELQIDLGGNSIGSGSFPIFTDFQAQFTGSYSVLLQSGSFDILISLTDQSPTSTSGPCKVTINDQVDNAATYKVNSQKLIIATTLNDTPIEIYQSKNGTEVDNVSNHDLWIG